MTAYYNEFDPHAAAWLRELIKQGLIADGEVDDRSIKDVSASDLVGFTQHHFFAGVAGWSYALRLAGWSDDRPVCTASLPCQPFSVAGKQEGKDDERHLLPHFIELVRACNFRTIFGEQVPGAIKHGWLDDLYAEMEREDYAVGAVVLTAAGIGAPHIRQRLYWVASRVAHSRLSDTSSTRLQGHRGFEQVAVSQGRQRTERYDSACCGLGDTKLHGHHASEVGRSIGAGEDQGGLLELERPSPSVWLGDSNSDRPQSRCEATKCARYRDTINTAGWDDIKWLYCRDQKYRPIKPSIAPVVDGLSRDMVSGGDSGAPLDADKTQEARVMRLKGYGNAIVPQVAAEFIQVFMEVS